jgi:PhnB protein
MKASTHLSFNGQCAAAFKFYERAIGAKMTFSLTWGDSPMAEQVPPEWREKICHASLSVGNDVISAADSPPQYYTQPNGFCVALSTSDLAEAERVFKALAEGGKVNMEFQKTFWSPGFGMAIDQFGIPWMVNCEPQAS